MSVDSQLTQLLKTLMESLEAVGEESEELYDTDVREQMSAALHDGFVVPTDGFVLPEKFGMFSDEADLLVRQAIDAYIMAAKLRAKELSLAPGEQRLAAIEQEGVRTSQEEQEFDDFFGVSESVE